MTALAIRQLEACEGDNGRCVATPVVRFQYAVLCYAHGREEGAAHCEGCHRLFDPEEEGDVDVGPDVLDLCGECLAEELER